MQPRSAVRVRVPAKINLFLAVRGVREDGYHDLCTVLQTVDLHDELVCSLHGSDWARAHPAARQLMTLQLVHDGGPGVPEGEDNLVVRAAHAVLARLGVDAVDRAELPSDARPSTRLQLRKSIPVAAGMAGGSADAAAALLALDRLWEAGLGSEELHDLAAELGADVPFCLTGGTALATGTGTSTARVLARGTFHWVVCPSEGEGLSTPEVFAAHDRLPGDAAGASGSRREPDAVLLALGTGDVQLLAEGLHNDLEAAAVALRPELGDGLTAIRAAGARAALVSGSGPTLLGLADDAEHAARLVAELAPRFPRAVAATSAAGGPRLSVCRTPGSGPAGFG